MVKEKERQILKKGGQGGNRRGGRGKEVETGLEGGSGEKTFARYFTTVLLLEGYLKE